MIDREIKHPQKALKIILGGIRLLGRLFTEWKKHTARKNVKRKESIRCVGGKTCNYRPVKRILYLYDSKTGND